MKLFSIYEDDLGKLESALPRICERAGQSLNDPAMQVLFEECKEILSNIRWNYGPPTEVIQIPASRSE